MVKNKQCQWLPVITTICAFVLLFSMGTWQVFRLQWKQKLISQVQEQLHRPPLTTLPLHDAQLAGQLYREVLLTGTFSAEEFHVWMGTIIPGGKPGLDVLAPFKLEDGRWILIDRGWVVQSKMDAGKRAIPNPGQAYTVRGIVLEGEKKPMVAVGHQIDKNTWFWVDIPAMAKHSNKIFPPYYIREIKEADQQGEVDGYIKGDKEIRVRNDHLQYAITWYLLSAAVVIIFVVYRRQQAKQSNQPKS
ncbi:MAG: SURF1 family protein [Alphaproteobacteria bacterium]|nr:SURF1 family protein [Alphaproteobacteria bacterium]